MKTFLLLVLILVGFTVGCKDNVTGPQPTEDWTYPSSSTRDTVTVYCNKKSVTIGEEFDVKLVLYNIDDVFGIALEINYASDKSDVLSAIAGPFFPPDGVVALPPKIEPTSNRVSYGVTRQRGSTGITGSGVVIKLKCKAKAKGSAMFVINTSKLEIRRSNGTLIVRPIADLTVMVQ
jgi:hypothetical protein